MYSRVYDTFNGVTMKIGNANVTGAAWTYTPDTALSVGSHILNVEVENAKEQQFSHE